MARSTYVYVVWDWRAGLPKMAFTVKHELKTWWMRQDVPEDFKVWRVHDGPYYKDVPPAPIDYDELRTSLR